MRLGNQSSPSPSHLPANSVHCTVSLLILAELVKGADVVPEISNRIYGLFRGLNPRVSSDNRGRWPSTLAVLNSILKCYGSYTMFGRDCDYMWQDLPTILPAVPNLWPAGKKWPAKPRKVALALSKDWQKIYMKKWQFWQNMLHTVP